MDQLGSLHDTAVNDSSTDNTSYLCITLGQFNSSPHNGNDVGLIGEDPVMSTDTMHMIENVVQVVTLPVLILTGVTFNVINMAVFLRQGLSDSINLCIFSLALCDTGYMTFNMAYRIQRILSFISPILGIYWKLRCIFLISIYVGFSNMSNWLTLLISLERCVCVVWPLKAKTILSLSKIRIMMAVGAVFIFTAALLNNLSYDFQTFQDPVTNSTRYRLVPTHFEREYRQIRIVLSDNLNIFLPTVVLILVTANTAIIVAKMRSVLAWRQATSSVGAMTSSSKERREASMTRMLVVVCIIYTVCTLPAVTQALARFTVPEFGVTGRYRNTWHATHSLMHVFSCINSSVNFLVYYNMSTRFKDTLREMVCWRAKKAIPGQVSAQVSTTENEIKTPGVSYSDH